MDKLEKLKKILSGLERVVVAYSGGLDSTFLLKMAHDTLGKDNVIAVTARSETYPYSEYRQARKIAKSIGAKHMTMRTKELSMKSFVANPVNRCYYCKKELFKNLSAIRNRYNMRYVVDGTNLDDLKDIRYGDMAAKEWRIKRPLLEANIKKSDIRRFSKWLKLPTWDKPSFACLASRFPYSSAITKNGLKKIGRAEDFMRKLGFRQVRVRLHDAIARIEVPQDDLALGMKYKDLIINRLKRLGFVYVALDLEGYRTGSMHEAAK